MTREIVLDTETTGFKPKDGHKIVEIGCVELVNHLPTGKTFHHYLNPKRDVPIDAYNVHGLSTEFLRQFPTFEEIAEEFLDFIQDDPLIIHNAPFDLSFLNFELEVIKRSPLNQNEIIDTLRVAKKKFPGSPASLDALCRRFKVDNTSRTKHGALIDCELLAEVYLELLGGRQASFNLEQKEVVDKPISFSYEKKDRKQRSFPPTQEELEAHQFLIDTYIIKSK
jgi:DNA polymerase-3 subunit epsilon